MLEYRSVKKNLRSTQHDSSSSTCVGVTQLDCSWKRFLLFSLVVIKKTILFLDIPVPDENVSPLVGGQHFSHRSFACPVWNCFRDLVLARIMCQEAPFSVRYRQQVFVSPKIFHQSNYLTLQNTMKNVLFFCLSPFSPKKRHIL